MKSWGVLLLGLMFAGVGAWSTVAYIDSREKSLRESLLGEDNLIDVVVPNFDLAAGEVVNFENVSARSIPDTYLPDGVIYPDEFELLEGMVLTEPVTVGKPLLRSSLLGLTRLDSFASLLKKGQRPITLNIDGIQSNAGMLAPGDAVDIVLRVPKSQAQEDEEGEDQGVSLDSELVLLLERVVVLATDNKNIAQPSYLYDETDQLDSGYDTITVAVDLEDISALMTARQLAEKDGLELAFLMRHPEDELKADYDGNALVATTSYVQTFSGGSSAQGELKMGVSQSQGVVGLKYYGKNSKKVQKFKPAPVYVNQSEQEIAQLDDDLSLSHQ